jgi:hypothetical protein
LLVLQPSRRRLPILSHQVRVIIYVTMSTAACTEDLSPFKTAALTATAQHRLSLLLLRQEYSLRHVVGHSMLLDNLQREAKRKNKEKMAREASKHGLAPGSTQAPQVQSPVIVTVSELAGVDRSRLQQGDQSTVPRASSPVLLCIRPNKLWLSYLRKGALTCTRRATKTKSLTS